MGSWKRWGVKEMGSVTSPEGSRVEKTGKYKICSSSRDDTENTVNFTAVYMGSSPSQDISPLFPLLERYWYRDNNVIVKTTGSWQQLVHDNTVIVTTMGFLIGSVWYRLKCRMSGRGMWLFNCHIFTKKQNIIYDDQTWITWINNEWISWVLFLPKRFKCYIL
jgi:hypothetical protein